MPSQWLSAGDSEADSVGDGWSWEGPLMLLCWAEGVPRRTGTQARGQVAGTASHTVPSLSQAGSELDPLPTVSTACASERRDALSILQGRLGAE